MIMASQQIPSFDVLANGQYETPSPRSLKLIKAGLLLVLVCDTILSEVGYNIGSYFLQAAFVAVYILMGLILISGLLRIDGRNIILLGLCLILSSISYLMNKDVAAASSLLLLVVIFLPYIFTISPQIDTRGLWLWTVRVYCNIALFIAIAGILQFAAQAVIHAPWLFDYKTLLPEQIRDTDNFNTVIHFGSFIKSNGFFLREPSTLSGIMAFALIFEFAIFRPYRYLRMAIYTLGLLLSYSGSGILVLIIFSLFPLGPKTFLRVALLAIAAAIVLFLFGDSLNLWATVGRVNEFNSEQSSAYARYIAPFRLLNELFASDSWSPFVGHGPGMISRTVRNYAFHAPTWAKLLFEYGALGTIAFVALVWRSLKRSRLHEGIWITVFFVWFATTGNFLFSEWLAFVYPLFLMWPRPREAAVEMAAPKIRA